jgi:putative effector of murein hydrolase
LDGAPRKTMTEQRSIYEIWVYLSGSPLLALFITLAAFQLGLTIYERTGRNPIANPVAIAVILVSAFINIIGMPYEQYFEGAKFVHFLLGTATVSLAIPIYRSLADFRGRLPRCWGPIKRSSAACIRNR